MSRRIGMIVEKTVVKIVEDIKKVDTDGKKTANKDKK